MSSSPQSLPVVLVSACLAGVSCRYHGRECSTHSRVRRMQEAGRVRLVLICPEVDAGLPTPRPPTRREGRRLMCAGRDVTADFRRGAAIAVSAAQRERATKAYLVKGSPSCDRDTGVAALALQRAGVTVVRV